MDERRHGAGGGAAVRIEVRGLALRTHHGVSEEERRVGQRLLIDATLALPRAGAVTSDRIEETIDYGEVCGEISSVATARSYATLEGLCGAIGTRLLERFGPSEMRIRATKPDPPVQHAVDGLSVELRWGGAGDEPEPLGD